MTKSSDPNVPEIQSPPQRLATAKPRTSEASTSSTRVASGSTHQATAPPAAPAAASTQLASAKAASAQTASAKAASPEQQTVAAKPADVQKSAESTASPSTSSPSTTGASPKAAESVAASAEKGSADQQDASDEPAEVKVAAMAASDSAAPSEPAKPIEAMTREELLAALNDFPPELREQALRQFVAVIAKSAGQTGQPNALASELAKKVNDLPTLPDPASTPSATPPTRLAASESQADGTDSETLAQSERSLGVTASLSDDSSGALESVEVQAISPTIQSDQAAVTTASAARESNESPMVSQAIGAVSSKTASGAADATQAGQPTKTQSEQELLTALIKRLATASPGESEADRNSRLIKLRHLMVLAGDPDAAVEAVDGMAEAEQEYLRHHLLGLWTMIDPQGHPVPSRRFSSAIPQIREAAKFAAAATDSLEVRALAFCTEIESYGQIKPFSGNRFDAGQQVILYCEIENFTAKRVEDGYQTHLQGSYDVYNANNQKIFSQVLPADKQVSANYLRDYFIAYQMFLPSELEPGTYRLQLTMEDANGKKYGQSSIPFEIAK